MQSLKAENYNGNIGDSTTEIISQLEIPVPEEEHFQKGVSRITVLWTLWSFCISVADVVVIITVSWLHFEHQNDILAWMMLLPILFNFIGIFTFLSNENERMELEYLGGTSKSSVLLRNLMVLPIFGPSISTLRLLFYAIQEKDVEKFERLESLIIKMKQYESFFRASPEAIIQITHRIVFWKNSQPREYEDYWTIACISLSVFSLSESNFYGRFRNYYRIFTDPDKLPKDAWKTDTIKRRWRVLLFIFTYVSIVSRLNSDALFRASVYFVFQNRFSFGEVIAITCIVQFVIRAIVHALLLRPRENYTLAQGTTTSLHQESGPMIYRAFTYSWRSIFMSYDFQSLDNRTAAWFYIENVIMILAGYTAAYYIKYNLREKLIYFAYTVIVAISTVMALSIKLAVKTCYGLRRRTLPQPETVVIVDKHIF